MKRHFGQAIAEFAATGLGIGRIPWAPGTLGSLLGLPVAMAIGGLPGGWLQAAAAALVCLAGVGIVQAALPGLARGKDPGCVVIDEVAGIVLTFLLVPMTSWGVALLGFGLFRLFDISKPPPARQLERLPGGWGVMVDDWAAGLYANLALRGILMIAPANWFAGG